MEVGLHGGEVDVAVCWRRELLSVEVGAERALVIWEVLVWFKHTLF